MAVSSTVSSKPGPSFGGEGQTTNEQYECIFPPPLQFSMYCPYCKIFFDKIYDMELHEYRVHKGIADPLKCNDCEEVFDTTDEFTYHMAHHDESDIDQQMSDYDDSDRDKNFIDSETESALDESERDVDWKSDAVKPSKKAQTWVCGQCLHKFATKQEKLKHSSEAHGQTIPPIKATSAVRQRVDRKSRDSITSIESEESFICDFDGCGRVYKNKISLKDHKRKYHNPNFKPKPKPIYKCDICPFEAATNLQMLYHKTTHDPTKKLKCGIDGCEYRSKTDYDMRKHKDRIHKIISDEQSPTIKLTKRKSFNCPHCLYTTTHIRDFHNHQEAHRIHGPGPLDEELNFETYGNNIKPTTYLMKKKDLLPRKYTCDWPGCLRRFDSLILVQQHKLSHENRFVCRWPGCQMRAKTLAQLNDHKRKENHLKVQNSETNGETSDKNLIKT